MDRATELQPATHETSDAEAADPPQAVRPRHLLATAWQRIRGEGPRALPVTRNLRAHLQFVVDLARVRFRWRPTSANAPYQTRVYKDYRAYLRHQAGKLPRIDLRDYDRTYRTTLRERLQSLPRSWDGARVLCLGARIGTEVKAFLDVRAFAIGIDLNPGPANHYVVHGDFHQLQYPDGSADVVFSNSLDHVFDVPRWMAEVRRVLRPAGMLLLEVGRGLHEGGRPEFYESLCWNSVEELVAEIERHGFQLRSRHEFTAPAAGVQLVMERTDTSTARRRL